MTSNSNNSGNANPIAGALTFPSRSDNVQLLPEQPRQPRNLQGLLRFAMEATKAEDAPESSQLGPMDEERRKFLEEALKSLTVDVAEVLQKSIRILSDPVKIHSIPLDEPLPEEVSDAFSSLMDFIDDMDTANGRKGSFTCLILPALPTLTTAEKKRRNKLSNFYKVGGFSIFPVCYGSENEHVRAKASFVLAELCQNNPCCQARALESGLLNVLLNLVQTERGEALVKCIYAISCACREYGPARRELVAQGGCAALATLCACADVRARTKAAFLVRSLADHEPRARENFIQLNIIKTIAEQIDLGRDQTSEHLLSILATLLADLDQRVIAQCRDPAIGLRRILEKHLKHPDLKEDRFREEIDYCQEILCKVFLNQPDEVSHVEEADR